MPVSRRLASRPVPARPTRARVFSSLGLLCAPLAFHLAAAARDLPDGLWLMLVLSLWASLMSGLVIGGLALRLVLGWGLRRSPTRARQPV